MNDPRNRGTKISDIEHVFEEAHHALNGCFNRFPGSIEILRAKLDEVLASVAVLDANPNFDAASSVSTECDECGESIPDDEPSHMNACHDPSCSLYEAK